MADLQPVFCLHMSDKTVGPPEKSSFDHLMILQNDASHATKKGHIKRCGLSVLALPIFPGRRQPSIVSRNELNCRVRNGNGWTLALISTNSMSSGLAGEQTVLYCISLPLSRTFALEKSGDPYRIRTDVNGVRGRCLNHLTNGPWCTFTDSNRGPTD